MRILLVCLFLSACATSTPKSVSVPSAPQLTVTTTSGAAEVKDGKLLIRHDYPACLINSSKMENVEVAYALAHEEKNEANVSTIAAAIIGFIIKIFVNID